MTNPFIALLSTAVRVQQQAYLRKLPRAEAIQGQFLQTLLRHHQDTELGQVLKLSKITTVEQFRQQVPVWPYRNYAPYFERTAAGEPNVVTPDPVQYLNLSSGSTGAQKLIPVTARSQRAGAYANQIAMGFGLSRAQQQRLSVGKLMMTACANPLGVTRGGIPYGHVSGNHLRNSQSWLYRQIFVHPFETLRVSNAAARNYVCLLFALRDRNLGVIAATFPMVALQLGRYLDTYAESLIEDLASGEISEDIKLAPDLRHQLSQLFKSAPQRAKELAQIYQAQGSLRPKHAWPHLAFLITARGGPSDFYFERFGDYFGDLPVFGGTYASSEAVFGSYIDFDADGTLLAIESNFYEFVPINQWETDPPQTLLPHEVKIGEFYRILVTNYSGFYRYDIGDVVEVLGFRQQVPLITFRYRRGGTLSAISEKTTEHHVTQAVAALQAQSTLTIEDFCVTLSPDLLTPHYILNLELPENAPLPKPQQILTDFDRSLQSANISYALKREKNDILAPELTIVKPGSFRQLRQQRLKPGQFESMDIKLPHISCDSTLLEGLTVEQRFRLD
ncbi:MAG: GH3 auxin-responsive promoter family protein [Cyanobacteria bacterium P01_D01_bin.44]